MVSNGKKIKVIDEKFWCYIRLRDEWIFSLSVQLYHTTHAEEVMFNEE